MTFFNPCDTCLVRPVCRRKCDLIEKTINKLFNVFYISLSALIMSFGIFFISSVFGRDSIMFYIGLSGIILSTIMICFLIWKRCFLLELETFGHGGNSWE